jgi:hypothetical protein
MTEQPAYVIEVRAGPLFGEEVIRTIDVSSDTATPDLNAIDMIESYRSYYESRDDVVWEGREINAEGFLAGLSSEGISYRIVCTPPLPVEVSPPTQPTLW